MKKAFLSFLSFISGRFGHQRGPLCVNCGLPANSAILCTRYDMCEPRSALCHGCAEESGYTCYRCELLIAEAK